MEAAAACCDDWPELWLLLKLLVVVRGEELRMEELGAAASDGCYLRRWLWQSWRQLEKLWVVVEEE